MTRSAAIKELFLLDPDVTFLNHGSFGATPKPVFDAYQYWQREMERQPVEFIARRLPGLMAEARQALADYTNTQPDNLVYVPNTTQALNIIARGLVLGAGDQVLASDHEYGALDRTWSFLAAKQGFEYIRQPIRLPLTDRDDFIEQFWQGVSPATKVIFLSHITSATALTLPAAEICARAKMAGILTVIDGAHVPGQIPLDLTVLDADFYAGNLHKWLCAPKGSAFLYAHPRVQHLVEPLVVSWGWPGSGSGTTRFVEILEYAGTRDNAAFLAVPTAIRFQAEHEWEAVRERCLALARETQQRLCELLGTRLIHPLEAGWFRQMAAIPLPDDIDARALKAWLYDQHKIEIPDTELNGRCYLRVSYQGYNSAGDMEKLVSAVKSYLALKA